VICFADFFKKQFFVALKQLESGVRDRNFTFLNQVGNLAIKYGAFMKGIKMVDMFEKAGSKLEKYRKSLPEISRRRVRDFPNQ
jgi:hypothetical protein